MLNENKVILAGNLGDDPKTKFFEDGGQITNCSIATKETYKNKQTGENITTTEWHNIVFKGKLSELAEKWLIKGDNIYIVGKAKTRSWQDSNGNTKYINEVIVNELKFISLKKSSGESTEKPYKPKVEQDLEPVNDFKDDDDIPF